MQEEKLPVPLASPAHTAPLAPSTPSASHCRNSQWGYPRGSSHAAHSWADTSAPFLFALQICLGAGAALIFMWHPLGGLAAIVMELPCDLEALEDKRQKVQDWGGGICAVCVFFSPCLWSRNICWEPQTAEFSNTTSRCQATLLSSGTFTAEEINQSGNKEWRKFRKKCQKPNLSRIKWIRTLLVFGWSKLKCVPYTCKPSVPLLPEEFCNNKTPLS